ncbi:MAG: hypothetical protein HWE35_01515 [Rhodobacteraceae bacterium]|nr:hypothetical protein [Paracoccaceae bacterium]
MVKLSVEAPCRPHERLTVHHSGMIFTVSLNGTGRYDSLVPAFTRTAVFLVLNNLLEGLKIAAN